MSYCNNPYKYQRRVTREIHVGKVKLGGNNPVVIQSMLTSDTMNTQACVEESIGLIKANCQIVRITAPTVNDAANLKNIRAELDRLGYADTPIVADIHFKPDAAIEAAKHVECVRVNPGNFADKKKFNIREYTQEQYDEELARIEETFLPLVQLMKEKDRALRIGTNHGSLSDRIMNYYGDSPLGMVESALEFARICRKYDFHNFKFSMKSSNPKVMIEAYRLLIKKLDEQGPDWNYPVHLGVTEAGDGEDARIKSAIGIGSLLADGIGDTIRVSLTEDAIYEIPVAQQLVRFIDGLNQYEGASETPPLPFDPYNFTKRASSKITINGINIGADQPARIFTTEEKYNELLPEKVKLADLFPEFIYEKTPVIQVDLNNKDQIEQLNQLTTPQLITVQDGTPLTPTVAFRLLAQKVDHRHPILLKDTFNPEQDHEPMQALIGSSVFLGGMICDGIGDAVLVRREKAPGATNRLSFNILQASKNRIFKTEYVACPSCGRTLFNLQSTTAQIKAATDHLVGVTIAVMGCIVNGPGEMADADFGYVGGAPGKINLYVGKTPVKFNIPQEEAVQRLVDLIKEHNKWQEPKKKPELATA